MCVTPLSHNTESEETLRQKRAREERAERIVLRIWETVLREKKIGNSDSDNYEKFRTLVKEIDDELQKIEGEESCRDSTRREQGVQSPLGGWPQQEPGSDY